ncbi:MAG: hypothetical protein V3U82_01320 [Robiginitomaculum sp.]
MTDNQPQKPPQKQTMEFSGKIIVILFPLVAVLTWFLMESRGVLFQKKIALPFILSAVLITAGFVAFIALLAKLEEKPHTRNMVAGFFITICVLMGFGVFHLNGIF